MLFYVRPASLPTMIRNDEEFVIDTDDLSIEKTDEDELYELSQNGIVIDNIYFSQETLWTRYSMFARYVTEHGDICCLNGKIVCKKSNQVSFDGKEKVLHTENISDTIVLMWGSDELLQIYVNTKLDVDIYIVYMYKLGNYIVMRIQLKLFGVFRAAAVSVALVVTLDGQVVDLYSGSMSTLKVTNLVYTKDPSFSGKFATFWLERV